MEDKRVCSRCGYDEIKKSDNYCIICGLKIIKEKGKDDDIACKYESNN